MPQIAIREAAPSDRRQVAEMLAEVWGGGDYIMGVWRDWVSSPDGDLLVAEADGRIVGVMYVEYRPAGEAYLAGARVHPGYRRMGVATELTLECMERARSRGRSLVTLATSVRNQAAQRLAEKLGFELRARTARVYARPLSAGRVETGSVRSVDPEEARYVKAWARGRDGRPLKFDWYSFSTLTAEDVRLYSEEGFAFAVGRYEGVALWQPLSFGGSLLMIDYLSGSREAARELGALARLEAGRLKIEKVYGQIRWSEETLRGLVEAGFRYPKTRGMLVYEKRIR